MIISASGLRCMTENEPLSIFGRAAYGFASKYSGKEVLIGMDTRSTSGPIMHLVTGAVLLAGKVPVVLGTLSTPALFRESRVRKMPAIMITASHNEPEWNGLKLILNGKGASKDIYEDSVSLEHLTATSSQDCVSYSRCRYNEDFLKKHRDRFDGMSVALDLGGGSAIYHAKDILTSLGCKVIPLNDKAGVFARKIDPTEDNLELLCRTVTENSCDAGFAFDSDGDRLVLVDSNGKKLSGDRMLSIALFQLMNTRHVKKVVASLDTTLAVRDIAILHKARLYWSKVGEANVVSKIEEVGAEVGGEGSSGGLIDPSFNFCRDSLVAAYYILSCIRQKGDKAFKIGSEYFQQRTKVGFSGFLPELASQIGRKYLVEKLDGLKIWMDENTWVLVRKSNTEHVVRISVESKSRGRALFLLRKFEKLVREVGKNG